MSKSVAKQCMHVYKYMYVWIHTYTLCDIMCIYIYPSKQKYGLGNLPLFGRNLRPRGVAKITTDAMMMPTSQDVRIFNHSDWPKKNKGNLVEQSGTKKHVEKHRKRNIYSQGH